MKKMKKKIIKPKTLKGFRDFLPEQMVIRQKVIDTLRRVFESFGFEPLETPALEYGETLLGKYGAEADKLLYLFKDRGGRDVGLRFDLTVPLARVAASYPNLPMPFKRYQLQPVWRAEKPQKSRYREFWQCDIDTLGAKSPIADAEIIAVIYQSLKDLGFEKFTIKINSRQVLFQLMEKAGVSQEKWLSVIRSLDKISKIGRERVEKELIKKNLNNQTIKMLFTSINKAAPDDNLKKVLKSLLLFKVPEIFYQFDPTLARGLDYYTGPIFETIVEKPKIGSITGGGRWDELIGKFTGKNIPATGTTIGLERIIDVIQELNLWSKIEKTKTRVLITVFSPELLESSIKLASKLRKTGINIDLYPDPNVKLDKQLKYADRKGIPFVIILGPEEVKNKTATLKDMKSGEQQTLDLKDLPSRLMSRPLRESRQATLPESSLRPTSEE